MKKAVSVNQEELATIRSGRASPVLLHRITVDYYGTQVPLNTIANVSVPEPRLMVIAPYDTSQIGAIEKAILASDLGITPNNDGQVIRLAFPQLTEDRRKELIKVAHVRAEEGRVAVRGVRRHAKQELERMKKDHTLSEDEERGAEGSLQKLTDRYVSEVDANLKRKEAELSEV
ncbi:MAG: ribosome recycling factor [Actinomycetota bacterium]|nr:ribosome recycling factor [Actinomycetota bacterium]